jgi:hypothetical protein
LHLVTDSDCDLLNGGPYYGMLAIFLHV